jgi:hypothetical protein
MGIFIIRNNFNNKCHIQTTQDLRGVMNGALARIGGGFHPVKELQNEVVEHGADNFSIEILETLPYDNDETKTDYSEELSLLQMIWEEKLTKENMVFYKKRI